MKILKLCWLYAVTWFKENSAPTYIDKGFYSQGAEDDFVDKANWVLKWSLTAPNLATLETIEKYFNRYVHYSNQIRITKFITDMGIMCIEAIHKRKMELEAKEVEREYINSLINKACSCENESYPG